MKALFAVLNDLFYFVFHEGFGFFDAKPSLVLSGRQKAIPISTPIAARAASRLQLKAGGDDGGLLENRGTVYVVVPEAHLFISPAAMLDGVVATLTYGTMLNILTSQNRWYEVAGEKLSGFVLKDAVSRDGVYPQFKFGQYYGADSTETKKLRTLISDEFHAGLIEAPLQNIEYVSYRLLRKEKILPWDDERPRTAGRWRQLLRGRRGVYLGIRPKAESVMEVVDEDGVGHVAFVESIFPDETIVISEVGYPEEGQYSERTLPKEEWREFRPVFIEVA